jgi:hypothetical protein
MRLRWSKRFTASAADFIVRMQGEAAFRQLADKTNGIFSHRIYMIFLQV